MEHYHPYSVTVPPGHAIDLKFSFNAHQPQLVHVYRGVDLATKRGQYENPIDAPFKQENNTKEPITYTVTAAFKFDATGGEPWREHPGFRSIFIEPDKKLLQYDDVTKNGISDWNYTDIQVEARVSKC